MKRRLFQIVLAGVAVITLTACIIITRDADPDFTASASQSQE